MNEPASTNTWTITERTFTYRLSRFGLFSQRLRVAHLRRHFSELGPDPEMLHPPFDELPDADMFMVRPHPIQAELPLLTFGPRAVRYVPVQYTRSYLDLGGTFDEYLKKFSPKSRKNKQREIRQWIEHASEPEPWREFRTAEEMVEFHRRAREVARKSWQADRIGGAIPEGDAYLAEMQRLAREGRAAGHLLVHGDKAVSYVFLVGSGDVVLFEYTGFDPAYRDHSVGKVLLLKTIEGLFASGKYKVFDFGELESGYKDAFSTHQVRCADIYYFPYRPKSLASLTAQAGLRCLTRGLKAVADRIGMAGPRPKA